MRRILTIFSLAAILMASCRKDIVDSGTSEKKLQQLRAIDKNISAKLHSGTFSKADLQNYIQEKQQISSELKAEGISEEEIEAAIAQSR